MNKIKKYWIFLFLFFLVVVLVFLKFKYSSQISNQDTETNKTNENIPTKVVELTENESGDETSPTTEEIEQKTEKISPTIATNKGTYVFSKPDGTKVYSNDTESDNLSDYVNVDSLEPLLPYQGKYFRVEKYLKEGYLEAIVKDDNNFDKAKEEIKSWLLDNNTDEKETKVIYIFE